MLIRLTITIQPFPLTALIPILSTEKGIWKGLAFTLFHSSGVIRRTLFDPIMSPGNPSLGFP
jgi:hypothetical protein